jgi:hypothetical protein
VIGLDFSSPVAALVMLLNVISTLQAYRLMMERVEAEEHLATIERKRKNRMAEGADTSKSVTKLPKQLQSTLANQTRREHQAAIHRQQALVRLLQSLVLGLVLTYRFLPAYSGEFQEEQARRAAQAQAAEDTARKAAELEANRLRAIRDEEQRLRDRETLLRYRIQLLMERVS